MRGSAPRQAQVKISFFRNTDIFKIIFFLEQPDKRDAMDANYMTQLLLGFPATVLFIWMTYQKLYLY